MVRLQAAKIGVGFAVWMVGGYYLDHRYRMWRLGKHLERDIVRINEHHSDS